MVRSLLDLLRRRVHVTNELLLLQELAHQASTGPIVKTAAVVLLLFRIIVILARDLARLWPVFHLNIIAAIEAVIAQYILQT